MARVPFLVEEGGVDADAIRNSRLETEGEIHSLHHVAAKGGEDKVLDNADTFCLFAVNSLELRVVNLGWQTLKDQ